MLRAHVLLPLTVACVGCVQARDDISRSEIALLDARTGDVVCSVAQAPACPALDLGDAPIDVAVSTDLLVVNPSEQDLHITDMTIAGDAAFVLADANATAVVPAGAGDALEGLAFTLTATTSRETSVEAELAITCDATNVDERLTLPLKARGVGDLTRCLRAPDELDFGAGAAGATLARALVFQNVCRAPLDVITASITGETAGHFSSATGLVVPFTIEPAGTRTVALEAAPEEGSWTGTFDFAIQFTQGAGIASDSVVLRAAGL